MDALPLTLPPIDPLDAHTSALLRSAVLIPSLPAALLELARNAVDAGAKRVDIWLDPEEGGVRVTDDGRGVGAKELRRVGERFVSSGKGFGFRGESLASMGALGVVEITTRASAARHASTKIIKSAETIAYGQSPRPHAIGTTVAIRSLFSTLPVRATHLGASSSSNVTACMRVIEGLALVVPGVRWAVWENSKKRLGGEASLDVFRALYGGGLVERVANVDVSSGSRKLVGFISLQGSVSRYNNDVQEFVRAVIDDFVRRQNLVPQSVPSASPYKTPPRKAFVSGQASRTPKRLIQASPAPPSPLRGMAYAAPRSPVGINRQGSPSPLEHTRAVHDCTAGMVYGERQVVNASYAAAECLAAGPSRKRKPAWLNVLAEQDDPVLPFPTEPLRSAAMPVDITFAPSALGAARVLGQVDRKFIACVLPTASPPAACGDANAGYAPTRWDRALVLIDQHAADERVSYEHLLSTFCAGFLGRQAVGTVDLSLPIEVGVEGDMAVSELAMRLLARWGVEGTVEAGVVCVHAVPVLLGRLKRKEEVDELVRSYIGAVTDEADEARAAVRRLDAGVGTDDRSDACTGEGGQAAAPEQPGMDKDDAWRAVRWMPRVLRELIKSKACRGAIMFADLLSHDQCARLVARLAAARRPFVCAHGRPSVVPLGLVGDAGSRRGGHRHEIDWAAWRARASRDRLAYSG
ncbi:DNA mismatch repair protein [Cryptotrichosporon argae]